MNFPIEITLSFALNRTFFSANENGTVKQNNQSDFWGFLNLNQLHWRKMKGKKAIVWQIQLLNCAISKWISQSGIWHLGSTILVWVCDFKLNSCCALVWFWNHAYELRSKCSPLSSITIINLHGLMLINFQSFNSILSKQCCSTKYLLPLPLTFFGGFDPQFPCIKSKFHRTVLLWDSEYIHAHYMDGQWKILMGKRNTNVEILDKWLWQWWWWGHG